MQSYILNRSLIAVILILPNFLIYMHNKTINSKDALACIKLSKTI